MITAILPIFDKVKFAALGAGISAGIAGAIVGVVPETEAIMSEIIIVIDFIVSAATIGAITFVTGWFKKEKAVDVLPLI